MKLYLQSSPTRGWYGTRLGNEITSTKRSDSLAVLLRLNGTLDRIMPRKISTPTISTQLVLHTRRLRVDTTHNHSFGETRKPEPWLLRINSPSSIDDETERPTPAAPPVNFRQRIEQLTQWQQLLLQHLEFVSLRFQFVENFNGNYIPSYFATRVQSEGKCDFFGLRYDLHNM